MSAWGIRGGSDAARGPLRVSRGLAVISLNNAGHGYGPLTTTTVTKADGRSTTVSTPGSGYDAGGNGTIEVWEPRFAPRPYVLQATTAALQSAAVIVQLVRAIEAGVDLDGDRRPELDRSRIYYVDQMYSALYGMFAFAYEPAMRAAAFVVPPGTLAENRPLSSPARPALRRSPLPPTRRSSTVSSPRLQATRSSVMCGEDAVSYTLRGPFQGRIAHS